MSQVVKTDEQFNEVINSGKVIADFYAEWCGPCKAFAPTFDEAALQHKKFVFIKVDSDGAESATERHNISALPTIIIFKDGVEIDRMTGANVERFKAMLQVLKDA